MQKTSTLDLSKPKPEQTRREVTKTVIIAVLVTAIIAFITGMAYANKQRAQLDKAVHAAAQHAQTTSKQ